MRVIAGKNKGRKLKSRSGKDVRPTSDRAKEALFNMISGQVTAGRFLDLYAGFGGIGIEALSRGAYEVIFIEKDSKNITLIEENLSGMLGVEETELITGDVLQKLAFLKPDFDLIFADPPYENDNLYQKTLDLIDKYNLLHQDGIIIFEHSSDILLELNGPYKKVKERSYGKSAFTFFLGRNK